MKKPPRRVVVTQKFFDDAAIAFLQDRNIEVILPNLPEGKGEGDLNVEDIRLLLEGAGGWVVGHARITRAVFEALPDLAVISRRGVGYEKVDVEAARDLGRVVAIAAGGNDASVADQVIGMMISIGRRFQEAQSAMKAGKWNILVGTELYRRKVGIVGFGRIGRSLARRLSGFEAEILVCAPRLASEDIETFGLRHVAFETLLKEADYISVHAPLTPETRHMFNAAAFGRMKPSAVLINSARGGLVDDTALLAALESGQILGAGLDVYESESDPSKQPVTDALIARHDVIAAPHAGASTHEALARTNRIAALCAAEVIDGGNPPAACIVADGRSAPGS
ncbi:D-isomer specific 2-hydroxyacid dehydrogenase family protein [Hyphomonas neptunium ATCC 15444]|uniref:D-isomer specific 2-hydroxyacid dehydrogenase family protein n=2 Tax=Hyphomonas TaxID=85 RepID=Q0C254_HYPNA|nr:MULTISPECIES: phosphoglycerate dehydrogenase [Hyphomonas]ABI75670.1 D-isomer specific 2-hydroxyacid dehydrogenase family protein [Hyphomonas neptunium ATCC 15444]KCZ93099.1 D-isomer specific 2-hydroxyacid dehydrogenase family protein [Hyphomonas hirschiana VP5]